MIQIKAQRGENDWFLIAEVEDLAAGRTIVKYLDWLRGQSMLPSQLMFFDENTEVTAWQGDKSWEYSDQDPSGASDGVWFGGV